MDRYAVTIAIAIPCIDGVVLASDSMGHAERIATKVPKVQVLEPHGVSIATSGSEYMAQAVVEGIRKHPTTPDLSPEQLATALGDVIKTAQAQPTTSSDGKQSPHQVEVLIASFTPAGASVVLLPADLAAIDCTSKRFVAIGSATDFAYVIFETLAHLVETPLSVNQAKPLAYRIISTAYQVSSWGVGPPVQMATVTKQGAQRIGDTELEQLSAEVQQWLAVESSYLVSSIDPQGAAEPLDSRLPTDVSGDLDAG